jgi:hypothetical protein
MKKIPFLFLLILSGQAADISSLRSIDPQLDFAIDATIHASRHPLRIVDGKLHDLSVVFAYATNSARWPTQKRPPSEWTFIHGTVTSVQKDGVLVELEPLRYWTSDREGTVFLKNHPALAKIVDGDGVADFALEVGRRQYHTPIGALRTVPLYDFGTIPSPEQIAEIHAKKLELADLLARKKSLEQQILLADSAGKANATAQKVLFFQKEQATNGLGIFQYELGLRYLRGDGVETNIDLARLWLARAQTNGYPNAVTNLPVYRNMVGAK